MSKVRVLVVDDSPTMRGLISAALRADPDIEVVGGAGDPLEAREAIKRLNPDVITLDVEMPKMSGVEFLEKIMRLRPMPVIMVSTLTSAGAETALRALEIGAFDCVGKALDGPQKDAFAGLPEIVKAAAKAHVRASTDARPAALQRTSFAPDNKIVAIGASTGGVEALLTVLSSFPENCPPTVITQHMPANFTRSFAVRLDRTCKPRVSEAVDGALLREGQVYLAPGGETHLEVSRSGGGLACRLTRDDLVSGHRPSVDVLFRSVAASVGPRGVGAILTGMGRDGAAGLKAMRDAGGHTFGQDEGSCVVYGMPRAAFEDGAVIRQLPLGRIGDAILDKCTRVLRESA
ncbi:MAG: chemotaxis response regulator protein-glutamate methylesterase [Hyphomonadaceae bacterium]|nr:MAG: two-component system chemotaxis family response regulator CheB [Caulobacteraceae bacterium]MBT9447432.1 chemotaxis response regulator protein-glutamate methylesterase [Hyphomonadaceae bacterium]TPW08786.1 MAG: two-component system, chemotaxis family, response regulator CheB [Alphaproteobacteria bacterium]